MRSRRLGRSSSRGLVGPELCGLPLQPAARFRGDLRERLAEPSRNGRSHRPFHERGFAEEHVLALLRGKEVERGLGAQDGASEIHEHEHAVAGVGASDRLRDANRVGAERPCFGQSPGKLELHVGPGHLGRQLAHAGGERFAVRDDHDSDH